MYATQIRPTSVFISLDLHAKIAKAEKDIDEGKGQDAFEALDEIRAELNV